jgi:hypothetical protein
MNFTIFLNSRGRVKQLDRFITLFENLTHDHSQVEMMIKGDDDDLETVEFLNTLTQRKTFTFRPVISERPDNLSMSLNQMAREATGRYLFLLNDDSEILTPSWDTIALSRIKEFQTNKKLKDDVIFVATSDNSIDKPAGKNYSSFAIISAQGAEVLGFFTYEQFVGLGGDCTIQRIYDRVNRIVDVPEIQFDHIYHNNLMRVLTPDRTAYEMRVNTQKHFVDPFALDVTLDAYRLQEFINRQNQ